MQRGRVRRAGFPTLRRGRRGGARRSRWSCTVPTRPMKENMAISRAANPPQEVAVHATDPPPPARPVCCPCRAPWTVEGPYSRQGNARCGRVRCADNTQHPRACCPRPSAGLARGGNFPMSWRARRGSPSDRDCPWPAPPRAVPGSAPPQGRTVCWPGSGAGQADSVASAVRQDAATAGRWEGPAAHGRPLTHRAGVVIDSNGGFPGWLDGQRRWPLSGSQLCCRAIRGGRTSTAARLGSTHGGWCSDQKHPNFGQHHDLHTSGPRGRHAEQPSWSWRTQRDRHHPH